MSRLTRAIRFARHWHARIGVLVSIFILTLAVTGVALNHTEALSLARTQIESNWLMRWYGIKAESVPQGYLFEQGYFVGNAERWVMDGVDLPHAAESVVGVVEAEGVRYLATSSAIYLYQPGGALVEKMNGNALPATSISRIGALDGRVWVQGPQGAFSSEDGLNWQSQAESLPQWAEPQSLPTGVAAEASRFFTPSLPLERVILDLHSGRIFGRYGPLVMDITAFVLTVLSISGVWIYLRSLRKKH